MVKRLLLQHNIIAFQDEEIALFFYKRATSVMKGKVFRLKKCNKLSALNIYSRCKFF